MLYVGCICAIMVASIYNPNSSVNGQKNLKITLHTTYFILSKRKKPCIYQDFFSLLILKCRKRDYILEKLSNIKLYEI